VTVARVLVVDDEPPIIDVLVAMLTAGGHETIVGGQGAEIWTSLSSSTYDLVMTDLSMPAVDGWEVAQWVTDNRPGVPIVAVSGIIGNLQPDQLRIFTAFLSKPIRRDLLLQTVSDVLSARGADDC
jgi:CheY-like chemotaxis protein